MFFKANFLFLLSSNEGDVAERGLSEQTIGLIEYKNNHKGYL